MTKPTKTSKKQPKFTVKCDQCDGDGWSEYEGYIIDCEDCNGVGEVKVNLKEYMEK